MSEWDAIVFDVRGDLGEELGDKIENWVLRRTIRRGVRAFLLKDLHPLQVDPSCFDLSWK